MSALVYKRKNKLMYPMNEKFASNNTTYFLNYILYSHSNRSTLLYLSVKLRFVEGRKVLILEIDRKGKHKVYISK